MPSVPRSQPETEPPVLPAAAAGPKVAVGSEAARVIKKYPNRRLYDTATSAYITLAEVKQLVMAGERFVVRDAKSAQDLTRAILLQLILEEEAAGAPMFSEAMLAGIIRFHGHAMQGFMGPYLERHIQAMTEMQHRLMEQSPGLTPEMWAQFMSVQPSLVQGVMGNYLEQSRNALLQVQDQMQRQAGQVLDAFGLKR